MNRERSDKMEEEKKEKKGFFARLVSGLTKTRDNIVSGIDSVFHEIGRASCRERV